MDLKEARILLKKINSLFDSIDYEGSEISSIERDLMMNYLRQMHETFRQGQVVPARLDIPPQSKPQSRSLSTEHPPEQQEPPQPKAPAPTPERDNPAVNKRLIKDYPLSRSRENPQQPEKPFRPDPSKNPQSVSPPSAQQNPPRSAQSDIGQLFEVRQATDLSEKLSESPINDLNRALSINDRLLYMNELFGRDMEALNNALHVLNNYSSISDAKPFLWNMAEQYDWAEEDRADIAKSFIKLVRRRYQ